MIEGSWNNAAALQKPPPPSSYSQDLANTETPNTQKPTINATVRELILHEKFNMSISVWICSWICTARVLPQEAWNMLIDGLDP
jgi:hypothetical protein